MHYPTSLGRHVFSVIFVCCLLSSKASTDTPIAKHYRVFGPLPYSSSERGVNPLKSIHLSSAFFETLLSLTRFPSESAIGGYATWRDCPYNSSAAGVITAPFPDADPHLAYNAWAVANFSIHSELGRPYLLQCSDPATIRVLDLRAEYEDKIQSDPVSRVTYCPEDAYEDGRSLCSVRLWPGLYQIFIHLSSNRNTTSFYCNYFIEPLLLRSNLLLPINDTVMPNVVVKQTSDRSVATIAGVHCSVTVMNTHDRLWATSGSAALRSAPPGLKLAAHSESDLHYPLPRIAPRQIRQLRIDLLADPTFLQSDSSFQTLPSSFNTTIVVTYEIGHGVTHESVFNVSFDVAVWGQAKSYHFTFVDIDGSVQAAAVLPPKNHCTGAPAGRDACPVLLSTHGAGVDAIGRAWTESYRTQNQTWVLLPTGRRKYGLNWEGPQMKSAVTALRMFSEGLPGVPADEKHLWKARVDHWLQAGHSMGGHGALLLSTHFPDMLVAALPAMGWLRLSTYGSEDYLEQLPYSDAAARALLTLASSEYSADLYAENMLGIPFLARVGSDDRNVPPSNLRKFCRLLRENEFFTKFSPSVVALSEVAGEGHWFDGVVDDDVLQDFLDKHLSVTEKPKLPKRFSLVTMNPASSGSRGGLRVLSLEVAFQLSRLRVERNVPEAGTWTIRTENVRRFRYEPVFGINDRPQRLVIDDSPQDIPVPSEYLKQRKQYLDFCAFPASKTSRVENRPVAWKKCRDTNSWGRENDLERGPDTSGPASQVLGERKLVVVYPEGDIELQGTAVSYANALYLRGISAQVTPDSNISVGQVGSSGKSNMVLLGGPNMNRMAQKHYMDGYSADVSFNGNQFCLASLRCFRRPGIGISFLSSGPRRTLLFYAAGTDRKGLSAAIEFLPYSPASKVPEWIVVSEERGWGFRGLGGVVGLGYWDHAWKLEVRKSYPAEFAFDLKRSSVTCAVSQARSWGFLWAFVLVPLVLLGIAVLVRRYKRMSAVKPVYEALQQREASGEDSTGVPRPLVEEEKELLSKT